jgi:hypothetical protein
VKLQEAVLPKASVTIKVFVVVPFGKALPLGSPKVCASVAPLPLYETLYVTILVHPELFTVPVIFPGQVTVGFTLLVTETICVQVVVFPEASVTVHVTVVLPNG